MSQLTKEKIANNIDLLAVFAAFLAFIRCTDEEKGLSLDPCMFPISWVMVVSFLLVVTATSGELPSLSNTLWGDHYGIVTKGVTRKFSEEFCLSLTNLLVRDTTAVERPFLITGLGQRGSPFGPYVDSQKQDMKKKRAEA
jgi:hypothetical protein